MLAKLEADDSLTGVILTSGKKFFVVGADIDVSFDSDDPRIHFDGAQYVKALFRRIETLGKPVVAALNGTALGGGFELALACHYRVAIDDDRIKFGFPEVGLGLLPGAGGLVRTGRLIGLQAGLEWLSQNKKYMPKQALEAGMIHAVARDREGMFAQAKALIAENPEAKALWDAVKRYKIPGGDPSHPKIAQMLAVGPAMVRQETKGNYPAPHAIMAALVEGAQVDFETACRIESRYFAKLAAGQVSTNMITAFWTQLNQIKKGASRPQSVPPQANQEGWGARGRDDGAWHCLCLGPGRDGSCNDRRHPGKCRGGHGKNRWNYGQTGQAGAHGPGENGEYSGQYHRDG